MVDKISYRQAPREIDGVRLTIQDRKAWARQEMQRRAEAELAKENEDEGRVLSFEEARERAGGDSSLPDDDWQLQKIIASDTRSAFERMQAFRKSYDRVQCTDEEVYNAILSLEEKGVSISYISILVELSIELTKADNANQILNLTPQRETNKWLQQRAAELADAEESNPRRYFDLPEKPAA